MRYSSSEITLVAVPGPPPVKEAADYVTEADNNHDGVAEAIEKFIL